MPPKSKTPIKGQGSLASYFSGGGMRPASTGDTSASSSQSSPSSSAKDAKKAKADDNAKTSSSQQQKQRQEVKQLDEKVTVKGHRSSASLTPSPVKSKAPPVQRRSKDADEAEPPAAAPAAKSKYFGNGKDNGKKKEAVVIDDDDEDEEEEVKPTRRPRASAASAKKRKADTETDDDEEEDVKPAPKRQSGRKSAASTTTSPAKSTRANKARKDDDDDYEDGDDEDVERKPATTKSPRKPAAASKAKPSAKAGGTRASGIVLDDDEDEEDAKPPAKATAAASRKGAASAKAAPSSSSAKAKPSNGSGDTDAEAARKAAARASFMRGKAGPSAPGSKEVPEGTPNCLAGLSFVFTGQLESLDRDEAQSLVKRYGAKVTGQPSSKTSYVVTGEGAGPSKIAKIEKMGIKTLDEDGLLDLIRNRADAKPDPEAMKKLQKEEEKIMKAAKDMEVGGGGTSIGHKGSGAPAGDTDMHALWTTKYAPAQMKDLVGNNAAVDKLKGWLEAWPSSLKANFKKPGKHGTNCYRSMLISGPPGIGKTTAAHLVSRLCGYTPIELNASDTRSKKLIEQNLKNLINNKSLDGWYGGAGGGKMAVDGVVITDQSVLILDEVDGMSGGDRGGVGAINQLIKKTKIPIILIANDRRNPKMKPFDHTAFNLTFQRPKADSIRSRLQTIAFREKMKLDKASIEQLIAAAQNDIRLVINMLSTWKLGQNAMSYDESKALGEQNAKPGMPTPWSIYGELSSFATWSSASKKNLNDKAGLYFQDHSIIPLFVQENYLKQRPQRAANEKPGPLKDFKTLELMKAAASSVSDGDVLDGMIHGSQQHWSLMPVHAIASTVRPMSYVYGMGAEGSYGPAFPAWLGNNSKQGRLARATIELQTKMRLSASGSRWEVREQYLPHMFTGMTTPLIERGADGIEEVTSLMDDYYLGLEDRDAILELGVGANKGDAQLAKIPKAAKAAFTRAYNASSHPIALHKADAGLAKGRAKQLTGDAAPDAEEAMVDDEIVEDSGDEMGDDSDDEVDLSKDKMIKQKKQKAAAKAKGKPAAAAKGKGKAKAKADDFDDDDSD